MYKTSCAFSILSSLAASAAASTILRFPRCCLHSSKNLISVAPFHCSNNIFSVRTLSHRPMASISTASGATSPDPENLKPWLLVGLGNPGKRYSGTRHNVGFELVDFIAEAEGIPMSSISFKSCFGRGSIGNVPVMLAKPQTFMNASGESVGAIVSYYKIPLNQILVIFDDMDLPFAKLRLLPKGGHGGHNGMRSIITHLKGSRDFPRLRIGIGRPPGKMEAANFVLRPFTRDESVELDFTFQNGLEAVRVLVHEGFNRSATFVNSAKTLEHFS